MKRHCFALDLIDDKSLIAEYEELHKNVWPEIKSSIMQSGIIAMEIYRFGNRLFMIMEVNNEFDFATKSALDAANRKVQEWEELMWKYQQPLSGSGKGEKWMLMEKIFELNKDADK